MKVINRDFHRKYESVEEYEAGIMLTGPEVKSTRAGNIRLEHAFVKIMEGGIYVINAEIAPYKFARNFDYDPLRRRKLLLHSKEIERIHTKLNGGGGLTVIPLSCYNKGSHIKLNIALARGRGDLEKKNIQKREEVAMKQKKDMKEYLKK